MFLFKSYICITLEININQKYKSNKFKIIVPIWNDEFESPNGWYSVSDIQNYIAYIIK